MRRMRRWETGKVQQPVKSFQNAEKAQRCFDREVKNRRVKRNGRTRTSSGRGPRFS